MEIGAFNLSVKSACPCILERTVCFEMSGTYLTIRSHTGVMDYDEACFMHLTPGVVHNFPKAVGV